MPSTVNGIGTRYAGKKNLERFTGRCEFCRNVAELQNYETMLSVCILFIPIIPLGRKQILNDCQRCRRHRVTSLAKWREIKSNSIESSLAALAQQPNDPDAVCGMLQTYTWASTRMGHTQPVRR